MKETKPNSDISQLCDAYLATDLDLVPSRFMGMHVGCRLGGTAVGFLASS